MIRFASLPVHIDILTMKGQVEERSPLEKKIQRRRNIIMELQDNPVPLGLAMPPLFPARTTHDRASMDLGVRRDI